MHRDALETRGGRLEAQLAQRLPVMLLAMADARAVLVKLADRLQHMRGLAAGSAAAAAAAAGEALDVFAPLANRLGVWSIKAELEDLAFQARQLSSSQTVHWPVCSLSHQTIGSVHRLSWL